MRGCGLFMGGYKSIFLALLVLGGWLFSLCLLLLGSSYHYSVLVFVVAILIRTFLQTGLFIVSHDAMHGNLVPGGKALNAWFGTVFLGIYGLLSYDICRENHIKHHQFCGKQDDPDVPLESLSRPLDWYLKFMYSYTSLRQLLGLVVVWGLTLLVLPGDLSESAFRLACFWILPMVLSSAQLFVFGTYLPHRWVGSCAIVSTDLPEFWSLLSCYHFGYHCEHHSNPALAWHQLPQARRLNLNSATA